MWRSFIIASHGVKSCDDGCRKATLMPTPTLFAPEEYITLIRGYSSLQDMQDIQTVNAHFYDELKHKKSEIENRFPSIVKFENRLIYLMKKSRRKSLLVRFRYMNLWLHPFLRLA